MDIKTAAETFLQLVGTGNIQEGFDRFVASDFIHHNQYFKGSRDALMEAMKEDHQSNPNKAIQVKHSYVDSNTVILHSQVIKEDLSIAVVHIFRFHKDAIVELWDLGQPIAPDSPNQYGLF